MYPLGRTQKWRAFYMQLELGLGHCPKRGIPDMASGGGLIAIQPSNLARGRQLARQGQAVHFVRPVQCPWSQFSRCHASLSTSNRLPALGTTKIVYAAIRSAFTEPGYWNRRDSKICWISPEQTQPNPGLGKQTDWPQFLHWRDKVVPFISAILACLSASVRQWPVVGEDSQTVIKIVCLKAPVFVFDGV